MEPSSARYCLARSLRAHLSGKGICSRPSQIADGPMVLVYTTSQHAQAQENNYGPGHARVCVMGPLRTYCFALPSTKPRMRTNSDARVSGTQSGDSGETSPCLGGRAGGERGTGLGFSLRLRARETQKNDINSTVLLSTESEHHTMYDSPNRNMTWTRASLADKRHSKLCKFFQKGACALTAEECKFAHVKQFSRHTGIPRMQQPCKYFLAGRCTLGEYCRFTHPTELSVQGDITAPGVRRASFDMPHASEGHQPEYYYATPTISPQSLHSQLYAPAPLPSPALTELSHLILRNDSSHYSPSDIDVPSLSRSARSSPSAQSSDIPDVVDSEPASPDDAPDFPYTPRAWAASPPPSSALLPIGSCFVPGPYGHAYPSPYPACYGLQPLSPPAGRARAAWPWLAALTRARGRTARQAVQEYIKNASTSARTDAAHGARAALSMSTYRFCVCGASADDGSPPPLPPRPVKDIEEQHAKGYYPIMWRVIGGGVMMGGQRKVCQRYLRGACEEGLDCRFVHPGEENPAALFDSLPIDAEEQTPRDIVPPAPQELREDSVKPAAACPLRITIPAPERYLPDVSPTLFHRAEQEEEEYRVSDKSSGTFPERPHSTPPCPSRRDSKVAQYLCRRVKFTEHLSAVRIQCIRAPLMTEARLHSCSRSAFTPAYLHPMPARRHQHLEHRLKHVYHLRLHT
ncbi:hypothetical protein EVG20_g6341 [Dentipellis fragilis]|uniref:C3H1-type domain-containing protein n=1 Tax=Dentipellis fragilis TaxID=205917 RepID=A0A4Y9YNK1_9AGAM|nr:hypothetical protein EVG20_g6341 [Dentipellis fragilis]